MVYNDIVRIVCYVKKSLLVLIMQKQKRTSFHALINSITIFGHLKSTCLTVPSSARWMFILLYYQLIISSYTGNNGTQYIPIWVIILRRHRARLQHSMLLW